MTTNTRCSALPLAWACPESQNHADGEVLINQTDEPAEAGTAFHRWIGAKIAGTDLDQDQLAAEHGCDADELRMLCSMGMKALGELRKYIDCSDDPLRTEVRLEATTKGGRVIVGTADVLGRQRRVALLVDWKTGRLDSDYTHQTRGYGFGALRALGDIDEVAIITVWVRQGTWDIEKIAAAQLDAWADEFDRRMRNGQGSFNPGGHCGYCQRQASCPGRQALVRQTVADLSLEGTPVIAWTPETRAALGPAIGTMYGRVKLVEKAAQEFRDALKADVQQFGPLSIGGGRQLSLTPTNRRSLDVARARPVLAAHLDEQEIERATKISVSDCEAAVAAKAGRGAGAAAKRSLVDGLERAGAINVTTTYALRETKE